MKRLSYNLYFQWLKVTSQKVHAFQVPSPFKGEGQDGGNLYNQLLDPLPNPPPDKGRGFYMDLLRNYG